MARKRYVYSDRHGYFGPTSSISDHRLVEGFYRLRRSAECVYRPVRIWYGPPIDPEDGSDLDRGWRWQIMYAGRQIWDPTLVWPYCAEEPITADEYEYLLERIKFAKLYDRNDPFGSRSGRIDWLTATPP